MRVRLDRLCATLSLVSACAALLFTASVSPLYGANGDRLEAVPLSVPKSSQAATAEPDPVPETCDRQALSLEGLAQALADESVATDSELLADGAAGIRLLEEKIGKLCELLSKRDAELAAQRESLSIRERLLALKQKDLEAYREHVDTVDQLVPLLNPRRLTCVVGVGGSVGFAGDAAAGVSLTCGVSLFR